MTEDDLPVTLADVLAARRRIAPYLRPTPTHRYPSLDRELGLEVWVKHENHQPVGAFKVRGGVNLIARMPAEQRAAGVIAASTGNHGQSVAFAARLFGVRAIVAVPEGANPTKVQAMRDLGAEVVVHGESYDDARLWVEEEAARRGYRYIHSGNEPDLIAGVGTLTLEMLEVQPELDVLFVPVGGGSGAAGAAIVAGALRPGLRVVGVQAEGAPAAYLSWKQGRPVEAPARTFAEGLATGVPFELPQRILRARLDDFVLVSDADIQAAVRLYLEHTHNLAEGAGAAALAAARRHADGLRGRRVGVVLSGGNLSPEQLREVLGCA
ncbi:threonine/serine dehydratase [Oceanithermus sp.]|uniref:threonine ammonia-lyase n=1 Tax=Oceanithermus sp. TaxID=2268145 RepID=UPI00257B6180|nr:threonine/serine dehydratase [Oceanithermus sp.]